MAYITYDELPKLREQYKDKKIVFTSGTFDLTHVGHVRYLEACKELGDILVVAVGKDVDIKAHKGDERPILKEPIRVKMIDSFKPVDYTFLINSPLPGTHRHSPLQEVYDLLHPDIYVLNYDAKNLEHLEQQCKAANITFVVLHLNREEPSDMQSISTTGLIEKIKNLAKND